MTTTSKTQEFESSSEDGGFRCNEGGVEEQLAIDRALDDQQLGGHQPCKPLRVSCWVGRALVDVVDGAVNCATCVCSAAVSRLLRIVTSISDDEY